MAFIIEISEVGEREYPLLQTLRDTIFSEFGHVSRTPIAAGLEGRSDLLALIAHLEGNPVGFCVGYRHSPGVFYLNYLGVLRDYRGQGLGRQLLARQEQFARARGYEQIEFNTFNHFPGMINLGLAAGFLPIGIEQHPMTQNDLAIRFGKSLKDVASYAPQSMSENTAEKCIPADDPNALKAALADGMTIAGLVRDPRDGRLVVVVQSVR